MAYGCFVVDAIFEQELTEQVFFFGKFSTEQWYCDSAPQCR